MKPKHIRLVVLCFSVIALGAATFLALFYNQDSLLYYTKPSDAVDHRSDRVYRMGGLVSDWQHQGLDHTFVLSDEKTSITARYYGIMPDLFRVGQGAIIDGTFARDGTFMATRVLAKHDENYQPPKS